MKAKRTGGLDFLKSRRFKMSKLNYFLSYDGFFALLSYLQSKNISVITLTCLCYDLIFHNCGHNPQLYQQRNKHFLYPLVFSAPGNGQAERIPQRRNTAVIGRMNARGQHEIQLFKFLLNAVRECDLP